MSDDELGGETREEMEAEIIAMLKKFGVYDQYKDQIDAVGYACGKWTMLGNSPESLVYAICNNTLPWQAVLTEARVVQIASLDGKAVAPNPD